MSRVFWLWMHYKISGRMCTGFMVHTVNPCTPDNFGKS